MEQLIKILNEGNYSCVVENFDEIYTFSGRGVSDLYNMIKNKPGFLKEAVVADKVIGKGAAALMILGEIKSAYAKLISLPALIMLQNVGIKTTYEDVVPNILNRVQTDICPLEKMIGDNEKPEEILPIIEKFREAMMKNKS